MYIPCFFTKPNTCFFHLVDILIFVVIFIVNYMSMDSIVFPCIISIVPGFLSQISNAFIFGIKVIEGHLRINTPLCYKRSTDNSVIQIGIVEEIRLFNQIIDHAKKCQVVVIKIRDYSWSLTTEDIRQTQHLYSNLDRVRLNTLKTFNSQQPNILSMNDKYCCFLLKTILEFS